MWRSCARYDEKETCSPKPLSAASPCDSAHQLSPWNGTHHSAVQVCSLLYQARLALPDNTTTIASPLKPLNSACLSMLPKSTKPLTAGRAPPWTAAPSDECKTCCTMEPYSWGRLGRSSQYARTQAVLPSGLQQTPHHPQKMAIATSPGPTAASSAMHRQHSR